MNDVSRIPWADIILNFVWIFGLAVVLSVLSYHEFLIHLKRVKSKELFSRDILKKGLLFGIFLILIGNGSTFIKHVLTGKNEVLTIENSILIPAPSLKGINFDRKDFLVMSENGYFRSRQIQFEKAKYLIRIVASGSKALGETPNLKLFIGVYPIANYFTSDRFEEVVFEFQSNRREKRRLRIEFINDYYDPSLRLDRNAYIQTIEIVKLDQ